MKIEPIEKAYVHNMNYELHDYNMYYNPPEDYVVWAKSRGEAKSKMLTKLNYAGFKISDSLDGDDICYLDIRIKRCKDLDTFMCGDKDITIGAIMDIAWRERSQFNKDKLRESNKGGYCYIYKNGLYYNYGYSGYVSELSHAFPYTNEAAYKCCSRCYELEMVPVNIDDHNKRLDKRIALLNTRRINIFD